MKSISDRGSSSFNQNDLLDLIVKGQLPELYADEVLRGPLFYSSYVSTYLEKDVKEQIGVSATTIKNWVSALCKSGVIRFFRTV